MADENPQNTASAMRARLRAARAAMPEVSRDRGALLIRARLFAWLGAYRNQCAAAGRPPPAVVAGYWPMADEPDLRTLLAQWADDPALTVALPVISARAAPLRFDRWYAGMAMIPGAYDIPVPETSEPLKPDVVLVPTLGYTRQGDRVGYGAGYYDRSLAAWRLAGHPPVTIGIAWAAGQLDASYTPKPHDQCLDAILTQDGWLPAAPGQVACASTQTLLSVRIGS